MDLNGTRQFKLPTGQMLATYKSGYVRRCDSSDRIWQLNPKYKREVRWVFLNGTELVTQEIYNVVKSTDLVRFS